MFKVLKMLFQNNASCTRQNRRGLWTRLISTAVGGHNTGIWIVAPPGVGLGLLQGEAPFYRIEILHISIHLGRQNHLYYFHSK
jgi:hypothetical protein